MFCGLKLTETIIQWKRKVKRKEKEMAVPSKKVSTKHFTTFIKDVELVLTWVSLNNPNTMRMLTTSIVNLNVQCALSISKETILLFLLKRSWSFYPRSLRRFREYISNFLTRSVAHVSYRKLKIYFNFKLKEEWWHRFLLKELKESILRFQKS